MKHSEASQITPRYRRIHRDIGVALVEMALLLPLLVLVVVGVYELSRGILANNVISSVSREGANLYSRTNTPPEDIMNALAQTTSQLDMVNNGIIYMTRIQETDGNPQVIEQFQWVDSALAGGPPNSQVWGCSNWNGGNCTMTGDLDDPGRTATPGITLDPGEQVVAVEVYYIYHPLFSLLLKNNLRLYSVTLL